VDLKIFPIAEPAGRKNRIRARGHDHTVRTENPDLAEQIVLLGGIGKRLRHVEVPLS
jgi:hypothetical protein